MSRQKRKDAVEDKIRVSVLAFDLRYLNGESLVTKSFEDMRGMLREYLIVVGGKFHFAQSMVGNTTEDIQKALEKSILR